MSKNVTIPLAEPITGHKGEIKELVYRPPRFKDILLVGEAYTVHSSKDGERFIVENQEAIQHYAEVCLVEPAEYSLVEAQLGITDALRVKEEIMGFFLRAAQEGAALKTLEKT